MTTVSPSGLSSTSHMGTPSFTVSVTSPSLAMTSMLGMLTGYIPRGQVSPSSLAVQSEVGLPIAKVSVYPTGLSVATSFGQVNGLKTRFGFAILDFDVIDDLSVITDMGVSLTWSIDGGLSWSDPVTQTLGNEAEYWRNVSWQGVGGLSRHVMFKLSWACPFETSIQAAFVRFEPA